MSLYITSLSIFQTQIQGIISQFIFSTTNRFLLSLEMIMNTIQNNVLLSALRTNYLQMSNNSQIYSLPQTYGNCSCSTTSKCIIPSAIYGYPSPTIQSYIPGFYQGCYIIDALLQSNLQCLFNQTCLNNLQSYLDSPPSVPVTPLNSSILIQFSPNTSIHMLIKHLMVETWNSSITYDSYYDACQPMQCTYNIIAEKERIYVTTMLIGLIGGLIAILNFIIPRVVKFFVYLGLKSEPAVVRTMTVISRK
ncbi:hypothetical protein I4U23_005927 [Adineta vaga]|nr:hypothetical protein I4U23_005927 [Adineta vaga]